MFYFFFFFWRGRGGGGGENYDKLAYLARVILTDLFSNCPTFEPWNTLLIVSAKFGFSPTKSRFMKIVVIVVYHFSVFDKGHI